MGPSGMWASLKNRRLSRMGSFEQRPTARKGPLSTEAHNPEGLITTGKDYYDPGNHPKVPYSQEGLILHISIASDSGPPWRGASSRKGSLSREGLNPEGII